MRVVVPFVTLYPETKAALTEAGVTAEYINVSGDQTAYHTLLESLWREGHGFMVVEQDIVVRPTTVSELEACPEPWCGFAYALSMGYGAYLGCTRFSDRLVAEHPGVFEAINSLRPDGTPPRYWGRLDTRLKQVLEDNEQQTMHVHWPPVRHLNPSQQIPRYHCQTCGKQIPDENVQQGPPPYPCPDCDRPKRRKRS